MNLKEKQDGQGVKQDFLHKPNANRLFGEAKIILFKEIYNRMAKIKITRKAKHINNILLL